MSNSVRNLPGRRSGAAIGAFGVLVAGALALTPPAQADTSGSSANGQASASVLSTKLDVSVLNKALNVPLNLSLDAVHAPASASKTTLSAQVAGANGGAPFSVLSADVATARATAGGGQTEGYSNLVNATVHLPGLPMLPLIQVHQVTARATCQAGQQPTAYANLLGGVTVLGQHVKLAANGSVTVNVPGVGTVSLDLSKTEKSSTMAAATALDLHVSVNPLKLNITKVEGDVTLAQAGCETPESEVGTSTAGASGGSGASGSASGGSASAGGSSSGVQPAGSGKKLAETGGSMTPYVAAGAGALVIAGGAAVYMTRRRRSSVQL